MKPIRILDTNFEILGEIDNYESMYFFRCWHEIGEIEIVINRYKRHVDTLERGNIIVVGSDLHKAFIIKHKEIELTEDGKLSENWVIKGLELKSIIGQRITVPPVAKAYDTITSNAEVVMRHYVNANAISSTDPKRNIPQLILATNRNRGVNVEWSSRYMNLDEDIVDISTYSGLGWNVSIDVSRKKWVFDVSEGRNLTSNQSILPPVIFSPQFDSMQSLHYLESGLNYKNSAYVAGQGEGELRRIVEIGTDAGLDRIELFIDARDVEEFDEDDIPIPVDTINSTLVERGQQKLSEYTQEVYLEGEILTNSPFKYEVDYDLGDIVTMQEKGWGVTTHSRITKIKEIYEGDGYKIEAVFGKDQPTIIDKIRESTGAPLVEKNLETSSVPDVDTYTRTEVDTKLSGKSDTGHNHSGVYSPVSHNHAGVYAPAMKQVVTGDVNALVEPGVYSLNPEVLNQPRAQQWGSVYVSFISHNIWVQQIWIGQYGELFSRHSVGDANDHFLRTFSGWKKHIDNSLETPWYNIPFLNTWSNYGGWGPGQFKRDANGRVHLRGLIRGGSGTIFNLPGGMRPHANLIFPIISNDILGRVDVNADGNVTFTSGNNGYVTLSSISFDTVS